MKADHSTEIVLYPTQLIDPSPYQVRTNFDESALVELAESLKEHGVIQPLTARVKPGDESRLELIAGERRLRAAKIAGLEVVKVIVHELDDLAAREIVLIENLQREDLTVTEEARGYRMALDLRDEEGRPVYTQASLAGKIKKNESYIADRLKLLACPAELIQAVESGLVALSTAMLVGRIPDAKERAKAAKEVLAPATQEVPLNFEQTRELIRDKYMVSLQKPGFDLEAEGLVPVALEGGVRVMGGACIGCPFCMESGTDSGRSRNSETGEHGGELLRKSGVKLCTLPPCYRKKQEAAWSIVRKHAEELGLKVIEGDAARRMFASWNGELSDSSGYVQLSKKPESDHVGWKLAQENKKTWAGLLKGTGIETVIVRHPQTGQRVEVVDKKTACVIAKAKLTVAAQAAEKHRSSSESDTDEKPAEGASSPSPTLAAAIKSIEDAEALRKEQRRDDLRDQKIEKHTLFEALTDLAEAIGRTGMDLDNLDYLFQNTLGNSGADGFRVIKDWLDVKAPKGTATSPRDYEDEILNVVRQRATNAQQWLGFIVVATLAKTLRWSGFKDDDLQEYLKRYNIKPKDLKRRAIAIVDAGKKTKKADAEPAEHEMDRQSPNMEHATAGMPTVTGKRSKLGMWAVEDEAAGGDHYFHCDGCGQVCAADEHAPDIAALPEGAFKCSHCGDSTRIDGQFFHPLDNQDGWEPWVPENPPDNAYDPSGRDELLRDVTAGAQDLADGVKKVADILGKAPAKGTPERKAWDRDRLRLLREAEKLKEEKQAA